MIQKWHVEIWRVAAGGVALAGTTLIMTSWMGHQRDLAVDDKFSGIQSKLDAIISRLDDVRELKKDIRRMRKVLEGGKPGLKDIGAGPTE